VPEEVPEWTWDPEKARLNRRKHGLSFAEAVIALEDPLALTVPDRARDEERLVPSGRTRKGGSLSSPGFRWGGAAGSSRRAGRRHANAVITRRTHEG